MARSRSSKSASASSIVIRGAREHNLKNIDLEIPRDQFVVITGVSGSGKSALAFDILFAEGQRRFLDSMNPYARQYVSQLAPPDVDLVAGLPPTVSIEQRVSRGGGKSTVATVTEVYQFVRLLYARLGVQHCPDCGIPVAEQTRDQLARQLGVERRERGALRILAPVVRSRKGFHSEVAVWAERNGYSLIRANGRYYPADREFKLDRFGIHDVEIVVGELDENTGRLGHVTTREVVDRALDIGKGTLFAQDNAGEVTIHSTKLACGACGRSFEALDPNMFSYNSPKGWCPECRGFGEIFDMPEVDRGSREEAVAESWFRWREGERTACPECEGTRLRWESRHVRLPMSAGKRAAEGLPIEALSTMTISAGFEFFQGLKFTGRDELIARDVIPEIVERLRFLRIVGLDYLSLGRGVTTLSGGESQRAMLASQLGSNLSGALYVLDEPTIGLHARDNDRLLDALEALRDRGNSLIVVEHDEATMRRADRVLDLGPGAGTRGGQVVGEGTLEELAAQEGSLTGRLLGRPRPIPIRGSRRTVSLRSKGAVLRLKQARLNNLKRVTARLPLGRFIAVTGVSGSGKSSLILGCLGPAVEAFLKGSALAPEMGALQGADSVASVHIVDQSPIGRTPRSTPSTYIGLFDHIRALFSQTSEAQARGYAPGRFSFNSKLGRCPECEGAGAIKLEMNFLPTAYTPCDVCGEARFNPETLEIRWRGKNIAEVLKMTVEEALEFFEAQPRIQRGLQALVDTGLSYLSLGQTSPTLSGGEAQRLKLVAHLLGGLKESRRLNDGAFVKRRLILLEEPTIGLHMSDVALLVETIQRLTDLGHTVVVIEHNLDLIAEADWVIDLGPEGGSGGGKIVAEGPPEEIAENSGSHTGRYLKELFDAYRE